MQTDDHCYRMYPHPLKHHLAPPLRALPRQEPFDTQPIDAPYRGAGSSLHLHSADGERGILRRPAASFTRFRNRCMIPAHERRDDTELALPPAPPPAPNAILPHRLGRLALAHECSPG